MSWERKYEYFIERILRILILFAMEWNRDRLLLEINDLLREIPWERQN